MFNSIHEALEVLETRRNMTLGIDLLTQALEALGNPQNKLNCIHIGGTNGKGSTTNFTRSILQNAGYRVGTFTSPHLVKHNDRIRINDVMIPDSVLLDYINQTVPYWEKYQLSMFEIDMMISILYFIDQEVDWVVYEVGLGGRLDATNVIHPRVIAITNIDFDHMRILGNTLEAIAYEKAGIFKDSVPVLTTEKKLEAIQVFKNETQRHASKFIQVDIPFYTTHKNSYQFEVSNISIVLKDQGIYQIENTALAIQIIKELNLGIADETIKKGIETTHWAGRFEQIQPGVYLDGAHNEQGVQRLVDSLQILPKPHIIIFTALGDKEHHSMVKRLKKASDALIITEFDFYRAAKAHELAHDLDVIIVEDYHDALIKGLELKQQGSLIVTGSLYFISLARDYLKTPIQ